MGPKHRIGIMKNANELLSAFRANANQEQAKGMEKYMKNRFTFLGLNAPTRKELQKPFFASIKKSNNGLEMVQEFWDQPEREFHYAAIGLLDSSSKEWPEDTILLIEAMIVSNSWWDSVDPLSITAGNYFLKFPDKKPPFINEWIESKNFWLNRAAIIHQLQYKNQTDTDLLARAIEPHTASKEFFIRKAIGWALRQYARTDSAWVKEFVKTHALSPLSVREALKHLK